MLAVTPKEDCPHVGDHVSSDFVNNIHVTAPCKECGGKEENWICCKCGEIGCARYQKGHMEQHKVNSTHLIAASFSDFSFWCYACESYIKHPSLIPILNAMTESKFPSSPSPSTPSSSDATTPNNNNNDNNNSDSEDDEDSDSEDELIQQLIAASLNKGATPLPSTDASDVKILPTLDVAGIADYIKSGKAKNIIVMTGAGVSVAAGIPDFRTPGTGLYYNLQKYNLPEPSAVFDIDYFKDKPEAFYLLAKELYPGNFVPTPVHYFIRLLHEKGLLLRNYTQNIDTLERIANIPPEKLVEAHGTFGTAHCINCKDEYDSDYVKNAVFSDSIPRCTKCNGLVKPDIVFFGESLPSRFFDLLREDFPKCDLLIVIGTSLKVQPFASLIRKVTTTTPRLLINMESVGEASFIDSVMPSVSTGFAFAHASNKRDVRLLGECQSGVKTLATLLGWEKDLEELYDRESKIVLEKKASFDSKSASKTTFPANSACTPEVTPATATALASSAISESGNSNSSISSISDKIEKIEISANSSNSSVSEKPESVSEAANAESHST